MKRGQRNGGMSSEREAESSNKVVQPAVTLRQQVGPGRSQVRMTPRLCLLMSRRSPAEALPPLRFVGVAVLAIRVMIGILGLVVVFNFSYYSMDFMLMWF